MRKAASQVVLLFAASLLMLTLIMSLQYNSLTKIPLVMGHQTHTQKSFTAIGCGAMRMHTNAKNSGAEGARVTSALLLTILCKTVS